MINLNCFEIDYLRSVILNDLDCNNQILISLENYKRENQNYESVSQNIKIIGKKSDIKIGEELLNKIK